MKREDLRQLVHAAATCLAVTLVWLPPWAYYGCVGLVILIEWVVLPLAGVDMGVEREGEPWFNGIRSYGVAVLLLLLVFPLPVAAGAWGVMGLGDAASNVVGRRLGKQPFLGRADRSLAGSLAFVAAAWPAAWALHLWVAGPDGSRPLAALAAAAAGAAAELVPWPFRLDDNLPIALAAGAALHLLA